MNLPGLRLFSWSVRYLFVPASMRMSGDQDRAARHLPREETAHRMTLEHKYLSVALGMLAIAVAIQRREGRPAGRSGIARLD